MPAELTANRRGTNKDGSCYDGRPQSLQWKRVAMDNSTPSEPAPDPGFSAETVLAMAREDAAYPAAPISGVVFLYRIQGEGAVVANSVEEAIELSIGAAEADVPDDLEIRQTSTAIGYRDWPSFVSISELRGEQPARSDPQETREK